MSDLSHTCKVDRVRNIQRDCTACKLAYNITWEAASSIT